MTNENRNTAPTLSQQRPILNVVDRNSSQNEYLNLNNNNNEDIPSSPPFIDQARTSISSSIGPVASTPSSPRHYKPVLLASTQTYFKTIQQYGSSPVLQVKTVIHNDDDEHKEKELLVIPPSRPRTSSMKQGERRDVIATVRFIGHASSENGTNIEETYL